MISDIEKEWNLTLLERGKAGVFLTSQGEKLLPFIQSLCREYDALTEQVDELSGLHTGLIRIATFSSIATHWIPNIIKHFQADYPGIDYDSLCRRCATIPLFFQKQESAWTLNRFFAIIS